MNTLQAAYVSAFLADASYVKGIEKGVIVAGRFKDRLTQTQADFLAANFTVKDSVETDNTIHPELGTGFDAVVWEGKPNTPYAGQLYVSMRGTDGGTDMADDATLAGKGVPYDQIRDMVNWWMRISTPTVQKAVQIQHHMTVIGTDNAGNDVYGTRFTLATPVDGKEWVYNRTIAGVNGHSLGGYLATAFTRLFGSNALSVNTFNSAGFSNVAANNIQTTYDQISQLVGTHLGTGSFGAVAPKQTNFYAENGWNLTTNTWGEMGFNVPGFNQYGNRTALYQEEGTGTANHSMYRLTDLLALGKRKKKHQTGNVLGQNTYRLNNKRLPCRKNEQRRPLALGFIGFVAMNFNKATIATCKAQPTGATNATDHAHTLSNPSARSGLKNRAIKPIKTCARGVFDHKTYAIRRHTTQDSA